MKIRKYGRAFQRSTSVCCLKCIMQKNTPLYLLGVALFALSCESNGPAPVVRLRAERMSYGDHSYRVLEYDDDNKVVRVISGLIVEGEADESVYTISYIGSRVYKISLENRWRMEYKYDNDRVFETHEIVNNNLNSVNRFFYDVDGRINESYLLMNDAGSVREALKYLYEYDDRGNVTRIKEFVYNSVNGSYDNGPVMEFENFDDNPNAYGVFMTNFSNVYRHSPNNARLWRVRQMNGTVGEATFAYEYNEEGYVIKQTPLSAGHVITYSFEEY
jgi:hypothetical protein